MRLLDEQYLDTPFWGSRKMGVWLRWKGHAVNRKRVQRLMRLLGLEAIGPRPSLSRKNPAHKVYPYLLHDVTIECPNHVWSTDITYIRLAHGFLYLVAILDWYSRFVLSWRLSNTLDALFCIDALQEALERFGHPGIFNSDQGCQFTSDDFTHVLRHRNISISMDGRGRVFDNIFIERLWRSVKYEEVYLHDYVDGFDAADGLGRYFSFYNVRRPHQSLDYRTPAEVYFRARN